jgi:tRNA A22 N-methylase
MPYLLKIDPNQMEKLYFLREWRKNQGQKSSIAGMVREAIKNYLSKASDEIKKGHCLITERVYKQNELEKEYVRKKTEVARERMNPEKLKLYEKFENYLLTDK